jgi:MraZ protein
MFEGAAQLSLDAKGRLAIPARHREPLLAAAGGALVLTANPQGCLLLYPQPDWLPIRDKILKAPSFDARSAALKRVLVGNARTEELDSAGRLLVAPELRDFAGFEKTVWLVGMGSHFEIWSDAGWKRQHEVAFEALGSDVSPPGFEDISL